MNNDKDCIKAKDVKPGIYRHYKNQKEYEVIGVAISAENEEEMVVYQALYGENNLFVRPRKLFSETVEKDGQIIPRFEFISEAKSFEHRYKRALADYQNLLKQTAKEKEEFAKYANEMLLYEIIPIYDNLKLSLAHIDEQACQKGWGEGIKHITKQFGDVLAGLGVKEIKTAGEKYDHHTMEAVENEATEEKDEDSLVAREVKTGYKLNGKVIIPARVVVYQLKIKND